MMSYGNYPDLSKVKKVLVVKLRQLGDVLLTGPVFESLKKRLPEAQIDAYVYKESFELLKGHPAIHSLIGYDRGWKKLSFWQRIKKEFSLLRHIRKQGYDLVINLTEGDRGAFAAKASRAKVRVGFLPKKKLQKKLYTHIVKSSSSLRHTVEKNLDALRIIGIFPEEAEKNLFLEVSIEAKKKIQELVEGPYILIHPTSRWRFKCLPTSVVRELSQELLKKDLKVVFSSGPDPVEREMVEEITRDLAVINLSGKLSLQELSALIDQSEILICVDSLPFHMASALKKKVLAVFGPTSEVTWGPWKNPHAKVAHKSLSCRPCYLDGCGGSKRSECLFQFSAKELLSELKVFSEVNPSRLSILDQIIRSPREEHPSLFY